MFKFEAERGGAFVDEESVTHKLVQDATRKEVESGDIVADLRDAGTYTLTASKFYSDSGKTVTMDPVKVTLTRS